MITVLTASIPEREGMLKEAKDSVSAQTDKPLAHLVGIDQYHKGAPLIYNKLAELAITEWITFLDDDDLMDPNHLEVLSSHMADDVDVVYSGCHAAGRNFTAYNESFDAERLQSSSIVPVTAAVRRDVFFDAGGFRPEWGYDWELWKRIARMGKTFKATGQITWTYRYHGKNLSHGQINVA